MTDATPFDALVQRLREEHSWDCPCICKTLEENEAADVLTRVVALCREPSDAMRESVARAIASVEMRDWGWPDDGATQQRIDLLWRDWLDEADAALKAALSALAQQIEGKQC